MTEGILKCPFCGVYPNTFYTFSGTIHGYPVLVANIQYPVCGIKMSKKVPYKTVEYSKDKDYGQTPFEYAGLAARELADKWNKRMNE